MNRVRDMFDAPLVAVTVIVLCSTMMAGPASGQDYPATTGDLGVVDGGGESPNVAEFAPGAEFRVSGGGFVPGSEVTLTIESDPVVLGVTSADSEGEIDTTLVVPDDIGSGRHMVKATGQAAVGGRLVLELGVEVVPAGEAARSVAPESEDDDDTGVVAMAAIAAAVVIAGGGWFVARARVARRH